MNGKHSDSKGTLSKKDRSKALEIISKLNRSEIIALLKEGLNQGIPLNIFDNDTLSLNEALILYLKDTQRKSFSSISKILKRSYKTVWQTYQNASSKAKNVAAGPCEIFIPLDIFGELPTLETVVLYLKDDAGMSFNDIALAIRRNYQTVWTAYRRAKRKYDRG